MCMRVCLFVCLFLNVKSLEAIYSLYTFVNSNIQKAFRAFWQCMRACACVYMYECMYVCMNACMYVSKSLPIWGNLKKWHILVLVHQHLYRVVWHAEIRIDSTETDWHTSVQSFKHVFSYGLTIIHAVRHWTIYQRAATYCTRSCAQRCKLTSIFRFLHRRCR